MRICPFKELKPGMALGRSLFTDEGRLLLRAGYILDHKIIRTIGETGRTAVYILEEGTEQILPEELIPDEVRSGAARAYSQTMKQVGEAVKERGVPPEKIKDYIERGSEFRGIVDTDGVSVEITSIVDEILDSSAHVLNQMLIKSRTGYNQEHAIDTTLISLLIGRRLLYNRRDLVELGVGAFLHDIGKQALPSLADKPLSEYTEEEHFMMREHPTFGKLLLSNSSDRYFMAQAGILYHHERYDGLGYPLGIRGSNGKLSIEGADPTQSIYPMAEIISVANAYDNLIAGRSGRTYTPSDAIRVIAKNAGTVHNAEAAKHLAAVICLFPAGSMVRILDCSNSSLLGSVCAVMKVNHENPHKPVVVVLRNGDGRRMTPKTVDLSAEKHVTLELEL